MDDVAIYDGTAKALKDKGQKQRLSGCPSHIARRRDVETKGGERHGVREKAPSPMTGEGVWGEGG
ncbi:MAG: hypothetical protein IVW55_10625 [Chloroflexi bacterium]|nr:hypothetical protein [Chloroflexota bacterium]